MLKSVAVRVNTGCEQVDLTWNSYSEPDFYYYDEALVQSCRDEEKVFITIIAQIVLNI